MSRSVQGILTLGLVAALAACGGQTPQTPASAGAPAVKEIKLSHSHSPSESPELHTAALTFQKYVDSHSKTLTVKVFPQNALGAERAVFESMQMGSGAACGISGTAILNNFNEKIGVLDLPFLWKDYDHVHRVLDGEVGEALARDLEGSEFKVLAYLDSWGWRNVVTSKREAKSLEDLKGLKVRTIGTPTYLEAMKLLGCNPTPMSYGEIYTGMQTGVLDGFEHSASVVLAEKLYEVSKYIALTHHLFGPVAFCYSKPSWDKLTPEEQKVVQEAAKAAQLENRDLAPKRDAEYFAALKEKGMVIHDIDTASIQAAAREIQDKIAAERGAMDLLAKIRAAAQ